MKEELDKKSKSLEIAENELLGLKAEINMKLTKLKL